MPSNMRCAVCGRELYNEFSKYCSKTCENKVEIPLQKTELVSHTENMPNESLGTDLLRRESNGKREFNINVNLSHQESEFAPYLRDEPSFGFALLGFLFPYVGLVVYFIIKEEKPLKARSCIKGVIWGVVLTVIFGFMYFTWLDSGDSSPAQGNAKQSNLTIEDLDNSPYSNRDYMVIFKGWNPYLKEDPKVEQKRVRDILRVPDMRVLIDMACYNPWLIPSEKAMRDTLDRLGSRLGNTCIPGFLGAAEYMKSKK